MLIVLNLLSKKRTICTILENTICMSNPGRVKCGVPQGSILDPLLLLIFVNDMASSIDHDCKLILYADDNCNFISSQKSRLYFRKT